jgi:predicted ABC-class ATPase
MSIDAGGQEVLERTAVVLGDEWVETRIEIGLPARGRTILGTQAEVMLCQEIPSIVNKALLWAQTSQEACRGFVDQVENFSSIQSQLASRGLVAFVADGAMLPRTSGASDRPLEATRVTKWHAPDSLAVSFNVPHSIEGSSGDTTMIRGLGIPQGVTLIVGGGYHGKSTLLQALQRGVYPHIPADGRELVVTSPDAVKIRAEDGRRIEKVDISGFIQHLPRKASTKNFSTDDASGSTSQAASILEAVEVGARVLLLDEDTSATNFMVRDARMQALVRKAHEPITPFLDRVRELYESFGVSTVLVMGGCGDYFEVADTVIMMNEFSPVDVTIEAHAVAAKFPTSRQCEITESLATGLPRVPQGDSVNAVKGRDAVKILARSRQELVFGHEVIDLLGVEQVVDVSQTRAIGQVFHLAATRLMDGVRTMKDVMESIEGLIDEQGLDVLSPYSVFDRHPGNFARPRRFEIAAALNRLRTVRMGQKDGLS